MSRFAHLADGVVNGIDALVDEYGALGLMNAFAEMYPSTWEMRAPLDVDKLVLEAAEAVADACDEDKTHEDYYHLHPCCNGTKSENEFFQSLLDSLEVAVLARRKAQG